MSSRGKPGTGQGQETIGGAPEGGKLHPYFGRKRLVEKKKGKSPAASVQKPCGGRLFRHTTNTANLRSIHCAPCMSMDSLASYWPKGFGWIADGGTWTGKVGWPLINYLIVCRIPYAASRQFMSLPILRVVRVCWGRVGNEPVSVVLLISARVAKMRRQRDVVVSG
ncbi:hypothetical protein LZ32DRAFT_459535 [Colletotrichum eremochloae]|nr:hypothetical protein LZ32DRAFT_459535 [Colletotrichum eremochloae]